jgi:hypothetical protein
MRCINFIVIVLIGIGCTSEITPEVIEDPLLGLPDLGPVRFDAPAIGQRSYYTYFTALSGEEFNYSGDTIVMAITGINSSGWELKEFLTKQSVSKTNKTENHTWKAFADSIFVSSLNIQSDSIVVTRPAQFAYNTFSLAGKRNAFQFLPVPDSEPLNSECLPLFDYASTRWVEYSTNFSNLGTTYDRLNLHFDYRDMTTDGFGFMYVYSPSSGFVRLTWISFWNLNKVSGWDLVNP